MIALAVIAALFLPMGKAKHAILVEEQLHDHPTHVHFYGCRRLSRMSVRCGVLEETIEEATETTVGVYIITFSKVTVTLERVHGVTFLRVRR